MNNKPLKLYHCTTPKKAQLYKSTGHIIFPVRGFTTVEAAMLWSMKTRRTVIYEIDTSNEENIYKLPDHHNQFGDAWWIERNINTSELKCVISVS